MDYEENQMDWQKHAKPMNRRPQRWTPHWWRRKPSAWTTGRILARWTPHLHYHASSTSQCVLCIEESMSFRWPPLLSPLFSAACPYRALWGEFSVGCHWCMHMAMGKTKQMLTLKHSQYILYERMHTDAQSYTAPLKYFAVYMYSMSTMYSLRCCTLHVDL